MENDKMIFLLQSLATPAELTADLIGVQVVARDPRELIRMMAIAMDRYPEVKLAVLSAAVTYMNEHNLTFEDLLKNRL